MIELVRGSQFRSHVQAVLLQRIAVAGFDVVDVHALHDALEVPVLVLMRRPPRMTRIREALFDHVPGAARKWSLIERAGAIERLGSLYCRARRAQPLGGPRARWRHHPAWQLARSAAARAK